MSMLATATQSVVARSVVGRLGRSSLRAAVHASAEASSFTGRRCLPVAQLRHLRAGLSRRDTLGAGLILTGATNAQPARAMFGGGKTIPAPADVAAPPKDAEVTPSGLASKVLTAGTGGDRPGPADKVTVDYTGWTTDGKMFDSSVVRGQNITFGLNQVIAGWTEGLQLMTAGETRRLWIPESLAYKGQPGRPAGMLVFDVTLYSFVAMPKPPPVPADVAAAPADAEVTASGLASKMLKAGKGGAKPTANSTVTVNYSGWTTKGVLFDSSIPRGEPISFPLKNVIAGWTEGLQLMTVGESRRFWIPAKLAYGEKPPQGAPAGMLVFDVDLLQFN